MITKKKHVKYCILNASDCTIINHSFNLQLLWVLFFVFCFWVHPSYKIIGPHSQHICDFVRASVVFDTVEDLLNGCEKFKQRFRKSGSGLQSIRAITRIKNGFAKVFNNNNGGDVNVSNMDLSKFEYCDIKFNVKMFLGRHMCRGEVQFLLKWMLDAKKMGHNIYSFVRKATLFTKVNINIKNNVENGNVIKNKLTFIMLSKNLGQLSFYFENIVDRNQMEYILANQVMFIRSLRQTKWKKGFELFMLVIKEWKVKLYQHV